MISPEVLRRYPYFGGISDESLKQVAMLADEVKVPAGTQMFNEGDPANYLYLIVRGEVNIQYELGTGELRTVPGAPLVDPTHFMRPIPAAPRAGARP